VVPNYAQFNPQVGPSCSGTNHQDIQGVEKVVFLGDSITAMDYAIFPPLTASPNMIYRKQMSEKLTQKFPGVEIVECSKDGARNDDFLAGGNQIGECFPTGVEPKKTLILITMGGNDLRPWAEQKMSPQQYQPLLDTMLAQIREAIVWLKDPVHFPNGSFVIFANVYEFTDTSTDMGSCPGAAILGLSGTWQTGAAALIGIAEGYMKIAVDTQSDMVFMMETFCGHGYKKDDPNLQCYRGPGAELYFDPTCIHPSDAGATALANLFFNVVNE
jgi:lysophospholipase L1-like esterase